MVPQRHKIFDMIDGPVHDGMHANQLILCVKTVFLDEMDLGIISLFRNLIL